MSQSTGQTQITMEPNKHEYCWFNIIPPRLRSFLKAPGWFPPFLDMMIHNIMETILLFASFEVIFSSIIVSVKTDSGGIIWWIILLEIFFTYIGFLVYIQFLKANKLLYQRCFECLEKIYDCWCNIPWWIAVVILFPVVQIYCLILAVKQWMESNREQPDLDLKNLKDAKLYWKMADDAFNVLDICVKSKQASIIVVFIQDIPLFVICCVIGNIFGAVIFPIIIVLKVIFWIKHARDAKECGLPRKEHYYAHFGLKSVLEVGEGFFKSFHPTLYTDDESERARWEERDPINVYDESAQIWNVMIIMAIEEDDVIKVSNVGALSVKTEGELEKFLGENGVHSFNRWDKDAIEPLNDDEWIAFVNRMGLNDVNSTEQVPLKADITTTSNAADVNNNVTEVAGINRNCAQSVAVNGVDETKNNSLR